MMSPNQKSWVKYKYIKDMLQLCDEWGIFVLLGIGNVML